MSLIKVNIGDTNLLAAFEPQFSTVNPEFLLMLYSCTINILQIITAVHYHDIKRLLLENYAVKSYLCDIKVRSFSDDREMPRCYAISFAPESGLLRAIVRNDRKCAWIVSRGNARTK